MTSIMPVAAGGGGGTLPPRLSSVDVSKEQFLELLVAQLKNQDPLSPLEGTDFVTQLAQFSSLEQLINVKQGIDAQTAETALTGLTSQTGLAASLLDRSITARGDQLAVDQDGKAVLALDGGRGSAGGTATVRLLDAQGQQVAIREITLTGGIQKSNLTFDAPPGSYRYSIEATSITGSSIPVTPLVTGTVSGFHLENGAVILEIGNIAVPLADLIEVRS